MTARLLNASIRHDAKERKERRSDDENKPCSSPVKAQKAPAKVDTAYGLPIAGQHGPRHTRPLRTVPGLLTAGSISFSLPPIRRALLQGECALRFPRPSAAFPRGTGALAKKSLINFPPGGCKYQEEDTDSDKEQKKRYFEPLPRKLRDDRQGT